jgi:hypothetical protein
MTRPAATLSVDLDNLWSYLRAKGDPRWREYPSFLALAIPRLSGLLDEIGVRATVFVVGRDAECADERDPWAASPLPATSSATTPICTCRPSIATRPTPGCATSTRRTRRGGSGAPRGRAASAARRSACPRPS